MLAKRFDPLKKKMLQILDENGTVVNEKLMPKIDDEKLLNMYKTMLLGRIADEKAVQYQRQGRMLTFVINKGQEAAQVGSIAALEDQDWMVPLSGNLVLYSSRCTTRTAILLVRKQAGSKIPEHIRILPINIIIGSQFAHATGIAMAANSKEG